MRFLADLDALVGLLGRVKDSGLLDALDQDECPGSKPEPEREPVYVRATPARCLICDGSGRIIQVREGGRMARIPCPGCT